MSGFQCKAFYVRHDRCGMKVGTDSLLLGSWVGLDQVQRVLDIGTGSGILALMAAQRLAEAASEGSHIDAVELDDDAAEQAADNFAASPWPEKLTAHRADINHWQADGLYDLVISNPPYFVAGQQLACEKRQNARLESSLTLAALLARAEQFCSPDGRIALVLPLERLPDIERWGDASGWALTRTLTIHGHPHKPAKRVLLELARQPSPPRHETLHIYDANNQYSDAFKALTKRFYLAF